MRSLYPVSLLAVALAGPTLAQDAAPVAQETAQEDTPAASDDQAATGGEIVVTATRLRGQVDTDSPPVLELEEADVAVERAGDCLGPRSFEEAIREGTLAGLSG